MSPSSSVFVEVLVVLFLRLFLGKVDIEDFELG